MSLQLSQNVTEIALSAKVGTHREAEIEAVCLPGAGRQARAFPPSRDPVDRVLENKVLTPRLSHDY